MGKHHSDVIKNGNTEKQSSRKRVLKNTEFTTFVHKVNEFGLLI